MTFALVSAMSFLILAYFNPLVYFIPLNASLISGIILVHDVWKFFSGVAKLQELLRGLTDGKAKSPALGELLKLATTTVGDVQIGVGIPLMIIGAIIMLTATIWGFWKAWKEE